MAMDEHPPGRDGESSIQQDLDAVGNFVTTIEGYDIDSIQRIIETLVLNNQTAESAESVNAFFAEKKPGP